MARPFKLPNPNALKKAYLELGLSTTEIADKSEELLGVRITAPTAYNYLIRLGVRPRSKSDSVAMIKGKRATIRLMDVVGKSTARSKWNVRYWNARWLLATKKVKATNSMLTQDQAALLSDLLNEYGDRNALPESLVEKAFLEARASGFPYMRMSDAQKMASWRRLVEATPEKYDDYYCWVGADTTLATSFHLHLYECRKRGKMSPVELFASDADLKRAIRKALCLHGKINERLLNDICRNEDAAGRVGNFPPRVGKAIINDLYPETRGIKVLDPCAGFSGRMLSCAATGKVDKYLGIDLSPKTFSGLTMTKDFLASVGSDMVVELHHGDCVTKLGVIGEEVDMVLTSPPFFDVEEYVGVESPKDYTHWAATFLGPMISLCASKLRRGGKMVMYLENAGTLPVRDDCRRMAGMANLIELPPIQFKMNYGASRRTGKGKMINMLVWEKQ